MKTSFLALFAGFSLLILVACLSSSAPEEEGDQPNIILIISDDQSWTDYSFLGHEAIKTPRIDRLAAEGLRPRSVRAFITPMWANPRAPPPPRQSPIFIPSPPR